MDGKTEFEKEIQKIPNNDKVIGLDFSMSELFINSENQRADYSKYFRILEEGLKNYRNYYQEK
jgi:transposase, IS605 orfB family